MNNVKKQRILAILSILSFLSLFLTAPEPVQAQAGTAYEVLAEINGLRAANGLNPLAENQYLNLAAQNHASWIAATGQGGHTGEGGSSPTDRALAVGYGEGAQVWVTENWARNRLGASGVVYDVWAISAPHLNNMLTTGHNEFGAGVAPYGDGTTVYVVKFGHSSGSTADQPTSIPSGPTRTPAPFIQPVTTAEPNPDGSVIHVVQFGQTLWAIVDAYKISMPDLLAQNGLTEDSPIFINDELIIVPANSNPEEAAEVTPTPVTPTPTPSRTPTPTAEAIPTKITATPTENPNSGGNFLVNIFSGDTLWVGVGLVAVSLFGIALLFFTSARLR